MKKTLFFILAVAFCFSLAAQPYSAKDLKTPFKKAYKTLRGGSVEENANFVPSHRQSNLLPASKGFSAIIGETFYTAVTNGNARNTISWSPDGKSCAAVWTIGSKPSLGLGVRGTGINHFDQELLDWNPIPSLDPLDRIEVGKDDKSWNPGWGGHVFTEKGECVIAHIAPEGALVINYKENRNDANWTQYFLVGPKQDAGSNVILWPTICAVGDTIHLVCVTDNEDELDGISTHPLYYRSIDGGKTFEGPQLFETMPLKDKVEILGDDYVITARGQHVVLAYAIGQLPYMESLDGGDTWTRKLVYDNDWDWSSEKLSGPIMYPSAVAVAIGGDDKVHIAFSAQMRLREPNTAPFYYGYWKTLCGLFTWNDEMPMITDKEMGIVPSEDLQYIEDYYYDTLSFYMDAPELLGFDKFYFWSGDFDNLISDAYNNAGYISDPRLVVVDEKVFLMYTSVIEEPMTYPGSNEYYRGVFLTVSYDNGKTFDQYHNTTWLTYHPDIFIVDWSNYGGPNEGGESYDGYIEIACGSECGYASMTSNVMNYTLVFTWLNDIFPGIDYTWAPDACNVYAGTCRTWEAGNYNKTDEIWKGGDIKVTDRKIENINIYPNPVNDKATIKVNTNNPYTLTLTNIMGQVVYSMKGQQSTVELNVSDYPAGIYIVNVKTAHDSASQKLIVK
ncbi:MAG: T9SS type A sorting domain-containing protein [Bacteroidales bacterium]|nr:T9SS type A sorting domain-containing protein [Bacteroidales bacterium]